MATSLPSELNVGQRAEPSPYKMGQVAHVDNTAGLGGQIESQAFGQTSTELGQASAYMERARDDYTTLQAQSRANDLQKKIQDFQSDPTTGYVHTVKEEQATKPSFYQNATQALNDFTAQKGADLEDPMAKAKYDSLARSVGLQARAHLLNHIGAQREAWDKTVISDTLSNALDKVARDPGSDLVFNGEVSNIERATQSIFGNRYDLSSEQGRLAMNQTLQTMRSQIGIHRIQSAIDAQNPGLANAILNGDPKLGIAGIKDALDVKAREHVIPLINKAMAGQATAIEAPAIVQEELNKFKAQRTEDALPGALPQNFNAPYVKPYDQTRIEAIAKQVQAPSQFDQNFEQSAAKYNIPASIIKTFATAESGLNPSAVGPLQANGKQSFGIMQFEKSTAAGMKVDPMKAPDAIDAAANMLSQLYQKYGNWDDVAKEYYGGPNANNWGPNTQQYVANNRALRDAVGITAPADKNTVLSSTNGPGKDMAAMSGQIEQKLKSRAQELFPNDAVQQQTFVDHGMGQLSRQIKNEENVSNQNSGNMMKWAAGSGKPEDPLPTATDMQNDPKLMQIFNQLDPGKQANVLHLLRQNASHNMGMDEKGNSTSEIQLMRDIVADKVKDESTLLDRMGKGSGIPFAKYDFYTKRMEEHRTGHDVIQNDIAREMNALQHSWSANPVIGNNPLMKDQIPVQTSRWLHDAYQKVDSINQQYGGDPATRNQKLKDLMTPGTQDYIGAGSKFANDRKPDVVAGQTAEAQKKIAEPFLNTPKAPSGLKSAEDAENWIVKNADAIAKSGWKFQEVDDKGNFVNGITVNDEVKARVMAKEGKNKPFSFSFLPQNGSDFASGFKKKAD